MQGGWREIPVQLTDEMDFTEMGKGILGKYKQIVVSNYKGPGIDGDLYACTKEVLTELIDDRSDTEMKRLKAT